MKTLLKVLLSLSLILILSCEKMDPIPCNCNHTFELNYANFRDQTVQLIVANERYFIQPDSSLILDVPIINVNKVSVMIGAETVSKMEGRPNECFTYNYWW